MIPAKDHASWRELVVGSAEYNLSSFALRMLLTRVRKEVARNLGDNETIERSIEEVRSFFAKYEDVAKKDIQAIFG